MKKTSVWLKCLTFCWSSLCLSPWTIPKFKFPQFKIWNKFPKDQHRGNVTLVYKKGSKHLPSNYRPVSWTSLVVKYLEYLIHARITHFLETNAKYFSNQYGFCRGHSCQTQLFAVNPYPKIYKHVYKCNALVSIAPAFIYYLHDLAFGVVEGQLPLLAPVAELVRWDWRISQSAKLEIVLETVQSPRFSCSSTSSANTDAGLSQIPWKV